MAANSNILARKIHGQRNLVDHSPWCYKESDMTEHACGRGWNILSEMFEDFFFFFFGFIGS